jgi:glucose/arabinose dehydrogenase
MGLVSSGAVRPLLVALLLAGLAAAWPASAAVNWPQPLLVPYLTGALVEPVHLTHAGDGSGRLFAVERAGRVRIIRDGALAAAPFLDIRGRVESGGGEQGLLSIAFPPGYAARGYFYVYYTRRLPGDSSPPNRIARFRLVSADQADPDSETTVLEMEDPETNHNGGIMQFGPDGYLYVGTGDGGGAGDPNGNGQNRGSLLGKVLRLDVESVAPTGAYLVPTTNPDLGPGSRREIWAYGLRNPWRLSFDRQTGDLYVADVGQGSREEVNFQAAGSAGGQNYGWNRTEGTLCYPSGDSCDRTGLTPPVAEYDHGRDDCSVTGGFVYRGRTYPRLSGVYLYGDFCSGRLWGLARDGGAWTAQELADTDWRISSFGEDEAGELYLVDYGGDILRITDAVVVAFRQRLPLAPQRAGPD